MAQIRVWAREFDEDGNFVGRDTLIDNELSAMQLFVGGYIETLQFFDGTVVVCNDEGRIRGLPPDPLNICGNYFICRQSGEELASLTHRDILFFRRYLG